MQLTHYNTNFKQQKFPITLVCDNVCNAANIGSLFRIADAFGIEKIIFCGEQIPIGSKMTKTSRSTEKAVSFKTSTSILNEVKRLKVNGYCIIALEITDESSSIHTFEFPKEEPIALIVGDENFGVSEGILNLSDSIVHINMFGQNSSMNIVQATNIALYEVTKQII